MLNIKKRIKNVRSWNNAGFTLVEMLISLLVFIMVASAFPIVMQIVLNDRIAESGIQRMEWEIFSSQVKKEIRTADQMTVSTDKILMKIGENTIIYDKYGSNIRRRVNFKGYEILMQNLSGFQFKSIPEGVEISATNTDGERYITRVQNFIMTGEVEL
jgi:competence protein ComGF